MDDIRKIDPATTLSRLQKSVMTDEVEHLHGLSDIELMDIIFAASSILATYVSKDKLEYLFAHDFSAVKYGIC